MATDIYIYKIITRMFIVLLNLNFVKRFFTKKGRHLERNAASSFYLIIRERPVGRNWNPIRLPHPV